VILTYPLQFRPAAAVVETAFGVVDKTTVQAGESVSMQETGIDHLTKWQKWGFIPVRTGLVILTALLAASVPQLDLVISLAGSFTSSILAMMIPPAMDFAVMQRENKYNRIRIGFNLVLMFFGVVGLVAGTGATLLEILGIPLPGHGACLFLTEGCSRGVLFETSPAFSPFSRG
jgi:hypothetical protein